MSDFPSFTQNFTLTRCSTLTLNMIPAENKNTIHFKQRLLPNYLPHDFEIVTVNGGEGTSQYHTELAVAKFTGKRKKNPSIYFIATPRISPRPITLLKVTEAPIEVPNIFYHTVSFKLINFSFQIFLLFVPEMSASFTSFIVGLSTVFWFCILYPLHFGLFSWV